MCDSLCCTQCTRGATQVACSLLGPHTQHSVSSTCLGTVYPIAVAQHLASRTCVCSCSQGWAQVVEVVTTRRHPITAMYRFMLPQDLVCGLRFQWLRGMTLPCRPGTFQHQWVCPQQPQTVWCSSLLGPACKAASTSGVPTQHAAHMVVGESCVLNMRRNEAQGLLPHHGCLEQQPGAARVRYGCQQAQGVDRVASGGHAICSAP